MSKIEWKVTHLVPDDRYKLKLFNRISKGGKNAKVKLACRMWDLYELPTLRGTTSDVWLVKTTSSLEIPRFIITAFQNGENNDNYKKDVAQFRHVDISNIRLFLNSEEYPYERWNLDYNKKLDALVYYGYGDFQRGYYNRDISEPLMDISEFR